MSLATQDPVLAPNLPLVPQKGVLARSGRLQMRTRTPSGNFFPSTSNATVLLVFPTKSLKIQLSARRVFGTQNQLSHRARRPNAALFSGAVVRKSSSMWRSL